MYVCLDCKELFDEPREYIETHGFNDGFYETFYECPYCGSDRITDSIQCDSCAEWISGEYVEIGNKVYCDCCYEVKSIE